ncbi:MEMO1 family [Panaeolus papilionaceus]|nr:MEMO1 family [Panaeolus papilionaceus]
MSIRAASHAGSWYTLDGKVLGIELSRWLQKVDGTEELYPIQGCKAIIAPHAGYSYSGAAAAWAYKSIDTSSIKRVFILGPSHHFYLDGCALSRCQTYDTPIGELPLDTEVIQELHATGKFESMTQNQDQDEHSIEMHLPYVRKIFEGKNITIVPIVVGAISKETEAAYGAILASYLASDDTFFIVSSDFCHWGSRFSYTFYYPSASSAETAGIRLSRNNTPSDAFPIYQSISKLDHEAMDILTQPPSTAAQAHASFEKYLQRTKNTICGRHPIGVLLGALSKLEVDKAISPVLKWVRYEQSSQCQTIQDSSVSYASAYIRF